MDAFQTKGLLLLLTALGYAVATIGMKLTASQIGPLGIMLLLAGAAVLVH